MNIPYVKTGVNIYFLKFYYFIHSSLVFSCLLLFSFKCSLSKLEFVVNKTLNEVKVEDIEFLPTIAYYNSDRSIVEIRPLSGISDDEFSRHGARAVDNRVKMSYYNELLDKLLYTEKSVFNIQEEDTGVEDDYLP